MTSIDRLLDRIISDPDCAVFAPSGPPTLARGLRLPYDMSSFYDRCNGLIIGIGTRYPVRLLGQDEVRSLNEILVGEAIQHDRSDNWYSLAEIDPSNYVGTDLGIQASGNCFDCLYEDYGLVGQMPVIVGPLTELLERTCSGRGEEYYWLRDSFVSVGDAYGIGTVGGVGMERGKMSWSR